MQDVLLQALVDVDGTLVLHLLPLEGGVAVFRIVPRVVLAVDEGLGRLRVDVAHGLVRGAELVDLAQLVVLVAPAEDLRGVQPGLRGRALLLELLFVLDLEPAAAEDAVLGVAVALRVAALAVRHRDQRDVDLPHVQVLPVGPALLRERPRDVARVGVLHGEDGLVVRALVEPHVAHRVARRLPGVDRVRRAAALLGRQRARVGAVGTEDRLFLREQGGAHRGRGRRREAEGQGRQARHAWKGVAGGAGDCRQQR
mmetsp:Transcript_38688/g.122979  ORF Transcript_38688/g.122979 Transcript_38688/m.122979 type:complete len:255 (-) Transcript_38688:23-787(-)